VIIIAGASWTRTAADRDAAIAAFSEMVGRARQQDGCLDLAISADPLDPKRINLFECWRNQPTLDAWRRRARGPKVAIGRAEVKLYRTEIAEEPFSRRTASATKETGE
jgi:quinol monooxygenase YgiN